MSLPSPITGSPLGLGVIGEDAALANPYSRKSFLASSTPSWKSALRSRGNRGDGVGGIVSKLYAPLNELEVDRLIGVGAGALILGKADTGLLKAESSVIMMVGDCSGVGRGRRRGRSCVVEEVRRRPALYRRASLIQVSEFENHIKEYSRIVEVCLDFPDLPSVFDDLLT